MHILGFILALFIVPLAVLLGGEAATILINPPVILVVLGTMIGGFLMSAGPRTGVALKATFSKKATHDHLRVGLRTFRTARYCALTGAVFAVGISIIIMLANLDDPTMLGPAAATALLGPFYAVFFAYYVLLPLQTRIECRLAEAGKPKITLPETPLDLLVFAGGYVIGLLLALVLALALAVTQ